MSGLIEGLVEGLVDNAFLIIIPDQDTKTDGIRLSL
jgi:hypothetical protein